MYRDIQTGFTPARIALIRSLIDQLENELRCVIKLSLAEKFTLSPVGDRRKAFMEKAWLYVQDYGHLMPVVRSLANFARVKQDADAFNYLLKRLASLIEKAHDTSLQISSNYYDHGRMFYSMISYASESDQPGTQAIKDDLSKLFDRNDGPDDGSSDAPKGGDDTPSGGPNTQGSTDPDPGV